MSLALRPLPDDAALSTELASEVARARDYAAAAHAPATLRAYKTAFAAFVAWCEPRGIPSLPAPHAAIGVYLAHLAHEGLKLASLEQAIASIAHAHREANLEWIKGHPAVIKVMKGIRRTHGSAVTKKAPVSSKTLAALLDTCDASTLIGLRDRALLALGWFSANRRSEIVALHVEDVRFTDEGLRVHLRRSKVDQEGKGYEKGIAFAANPRACAVHALRRWLDVSGITSGPIFRGVNRTTILEGALNDRTVVRIVKRAGERAGLDVSTLAGHSLRSGFATAAAGKGRSLKSIMNQLNQKTERVTLGYIRQATLFDDNATSGM
jgi:site-specific recombinase XerD